jgi:hypothetical protein
MQSSQENTNPTLPCDHNWEDELIIFHNNPEPMYIKEYNSLPANEKEQLHVLRSKVVCTNCKKEISDINNGVTY